MKSNPSGDQRLEHQCQMPVTLDTLLKLGVFYQNINPNDYSSNEGFLKFRKVHNYRFEDIIEISPSTLENYEEKIKSFYDEHIHTQDEVRYILEGSGFFDIRDLRNSWIRIEVTKGDLISLPAGMFHRFTTDQKNYIKALRLFKDDPEWTPHLRSELKPNNETVQRYRRKYAGCQGSYMLNRFIHSIW